MPLQEELQKNPAHCAETIWIKNHSIAPAFVSTESWGMVCSCPLQHLHHHHLTKTLSPALVLIVLQQWFLLLSWHQPLSVFQHTHWYVLTAHTPLLISSVTTNFQEHKMQDKIAGPTGGFWVRMCPYLFPPRTLNIIMGACASCSWQLWGCWLWWAAPRKSWEPDLSCLQLILISRLLQMSHRGLIARKFMLTVLVLFFSSAFWHLP